MASNTDRRLDRLYGALSPKQRAILVLRAWKEDREPGYHLLSSRTEREAQEYNRIIDLLGAAGDELTHYLTVVHLYVGQLEIRLSWFLTAQLWALAAREPKEAEDLAGAVRDGLAGGIALRWRELGALEAVLEEIADEVDGEDALHPEARELFDKTKEQLQTLHQEVTARGGACVLEPPRPQEVEALRAVVQRPR